MVVITLLVDVEHIGVGYVNKRCLQMILILISEFLELLVMEEFIIK